jgi:hypothetical protein
MNPAPPTNDTPPVNTAPRCTRHYDVPRYGMVHCTLEHGHMPPCRCVPDAVAR